MRAIVPAAVVLAVLLACGSEPDPGPPLPAFTVADSALTARPGKTQYSERLVLQAAADTVQLRALLESRLTFARELSSDWHTSPTVITSYVFAPGADATGGDWLAMLLVTPRDAEPAFTFNDAAIAYGLDPPGDRFGMAVADRQQLYRDLVAVEQQARCEAESESPVESPSGEVTLERMQAHGQLRDQLVERYERALLAERSVTPEVADSITVEGVIAQWPQPVAPCDG